MGSMVMRSTAAATTTMLSRSVARSLQSRRIVLSMTTMNRQTFQTHAHDRTFQTKSSSGKQTMSKPGSKAFADCETDAIVDLFHGFCHLDNGIQCLDVDGVRNLLNSIGERPTEHELKRLFKVGDVNGDGVIELHEFLMCADTILGDAPARIVLIVGGPGSGKGVLCGRLEKECNVVHLSSCDLLRDEVQRDTPLGRECASIMEQGQLVSSAVIVALIRRRMRHHPGKRVLLDGFPRSLENAHDLVELCGAPELALHLQCDDTILMERIIGRGMQANIGARRADDTFDTALTRLRTYHKYHPSTMDWLKGNHVPIVNLDCSGSPDNVWDQLLAIGRLMRPVIQYNTSTVVGGEHTNGHDDTSAGIL